jgi:hypothetical protein
MKLLAKVFDFLLKGIKNNKTLSSINNEFSEAFNNELSLLWKKLKPIFIIEEPDLVKKIEDNPDDEAAQAGLKYHLSKLLEKKEFIETIKPHLDILNQKEKEQKVNNLRIEGESNIGIMDLDNSGTININTNDRK